MEYPKLLIRKFDNFTDGLYGILIKWVTKNAKQLFQLKGYLRCKTIFCYKVLLLICIWWIFLIWIKNNVSFSGYLDFCVFVKSTDFENLWRHHRHWFSNGSYTYTYFFWMVCTVKMKFGQLLLCCMRNISNLFLAQYWRLETSSRPFYFLIKITIKRDLAIFNCPSFTFSKKNESLESWHNWLLIVEAGF